MVIARTATGIFRKRHALLVLSCCGVLCCRRAWRVSQGCIDIDLPEAKLEVHMDQLDAATPNITCTKLSQVRLADS